MIYSKNIDYTLKHKLKGFSDYYITKEDKLVSNITGNVIRVSKSHSWYYYSLVNYEGKRCKVSLDKINELKYNEEINNDLIFDPIFNTHEIL